MSARESNYSATAPGYAQLVGKADVQEGSDPLRLVLQPGKLLPLRFVDAQGNPIPDVMIQAVGWKKVGPGWQSFPTPNTQWSDQEGRVSWSNAPEAEMQLHVFDHRTVKVNASDADENEAFTWPDGSRFAIRSFDDTITVQPGENEQLIVLKEGLLTRVSSPAKESTHDAEP